MKLITALVVVFVIIMLLSAAAGKKGPGAVIGIDELKKQMEQDKKLLLIDVRTPEEFAQGRIPGAVLVPLQELEAKIIKAVPDKNTYFIVYCRSGRRSTVAANTLKKMGYTNFRNYKGSFNEWVKKGNMVEK